MASHAQASSTEPSASQPSSLSKNDAAASSSSQPMHRMIGDLTMLDFSVKVPQKGKLDNNTPSAAALQRMDLEVSQRMVEHLLDNLQPYLWTDKRAAMNAFEEYVFKQYPTLPEFLVADILIGRAGKGRGLLETIGGISWKTGWLRNSSVTAMNLCLRLLDPAQNPSAKLFVRVLKKCDKKHIENMALSKHLTNKRGHREGALRLLRFFKDLRPEINCHVDKKAQADAPLSRRSSLLNTIEEAPEEPQFDRSRRLSARSMMNELVSKNILKGSKPPPPPRVRTATKIGAAIKDFFTKKPPPPPQARPASQSFPVNDASMTSPVASGLVFGIPLPKVFFNTCRGPSAPSLPPVLMRCCEVIEAKGMKHVGIFRLPGNVRVVMENKTLLDEGKPVDWDKMNVDTVTSILKLWFRELPEPIFTFEHYSDFVAAQQIAEEPQRLLALKNLCQILPEESRKVLRYLFAFLYRVSLHADDHKMNAKNLCMVFAPNLLRPREESYEVIVNDTQHVLGCVLTLLTKHQLVLDEDVLLQRSHSVDTGAPVSASAPFSPSPISSAQSASLSPASASKSPAAAASKTNISSSAASQELSVSGATDRSLMPRSNSDPYDRIGADGAPPTSVPPTVVAKSSAATLTNARSGSSSAGPTSPLDRIMSISSVSAYGANVEEDDDFDLSDHEDEDAKDTDSVAGAASDQETVALEAHVTDPILAARAACAAFEAQQANSETVANGAPSGSPPHATSTLSIHAEEIKTGSSPSTSASLLTATANEHDEWNQSRSRNVSGAAAHPDSEEHEHAPSPDALPVLPVVFPTSRSSGSIIRKQSRTPSILDSRNVPRMSKRTSVSVDLNEDGSDLSTMEQHSHGMPHSTSAAEALAPPSEADEDEAAAAGTDSPAPAVSKRPAPTGLAAVNEDDDDASLPTLPPASAVQNDDDEPMEAASYVHRRSSSAVSPPSLSHTEPIIPTAASRSQDQELSSIQHVRNLSDVPLSFNARKSLMGGQGGIDMSALASSNAAGPARDDADFETRRWGYWIEYRDDEGQPYYFNTVTNETRWEPPLGFVHRQRTSTIGSMATQTGSEHN